MTCAGTTPLLAGLSALSLPRPVQEAGTLHWDDCTPSCAGGTYHTVQVQITASNPPSDAT